MEHEERFEKRMLKDADGVVVKNDEGVEQFEIHRVDIDDKGAISTKDCDDEIKRFRGRIAAAEARKVKIIEAESKPAV